jgi:hypothetical protein
MPAICVALKTTTRKPRTEELAGAYVTADTSFTLAVGKGGWLIPPLTTKYLLVYIWKQTWRSPEKL